MNTEIITAAQATAADLRNHAERINQAIDLIVQHEDAFKEATIEPAILIGKEIAKAQELFGLSPQARTIPATLSRGVTTLESNPNPLGFSAWLAREIPRLNRTTASKYSTCFKALGLPLDSAPTAIRSALKDLCHKADKSGEPRPSLNSLYKQGRPAKNATLNIPPPGTENGKSEKQARLEDAREFWFTWREKAERQIQRGALDHLDKKGLEEMKEFQGWLRDRINARLKNI
jgi:hypothetical protein